MHKMLKTLSNILLVYTAIVASYTLYQRVRAYLNGGACPLPLQRPWLYSAIGAAVLALAISFWLDHKENHGWKHITKEPNEGSFWFNLYFFC